jgi:hypothetical protein
MKAKTVHLYFLVFLIFFSCSEKNENISILLNSITLSNEFYTSNTKQLRELFETKYQEQPSKYKESFEKLNLIEDYVTEYKKLETVKEKKVFIKENFSTFKSLSGVQTINFVCLNIKNNDAKLFEEIAENDFNRNLYLIYKNFYNYQYSIF